MPQPTDLSAIPSGMDNDPRADEEVINQQPDNTVQPDGPDPDQAATDDLANKLAYALDGSGGGLPGSTPVEGDPQKVVTEGITGAGLDEETA